MLTLIGVGVGAIVGTVAALIVAGVCLIFSAPVSTVVGVGLVIAGVCPILGGILGYKLEH